MHAPRLHIAAGRRARSSRENVADGLFGNGRGQEGAAGIAGGNGVEDVHGEISAGFAESVTGGRFNAKRASPSLPPQNPRHLLQAAPAACLPRRVRAQSESWTPPWRSSPGIKNA